MIKLCILHFRRVGVLSVFTVCIIGFMSIASFSWAGDFIPVPEEKPVFNFKTPQVKKNVIKYSLSDFAKIFFDSKIFFDDDIPPVPKARPFISSNTAISKNTVKRYKRIFTLQSSGNMAEASKEIASLRDMRFRGHVLYQRYMHPTAYRTSFNELREWLLLYADHPKALKIYNLAMRKKQSDFEGSISKPKKRKGIASVCDPMAYLGQSYHSGKSRSVSEKQQVKRFKEFVFSIIYKGDSTKAYKVLQRDSRAKLLDTVEIDLLQANIAASYLYSGKLEEARKLAVSSSARSGLHVPLAGWVAGLVEWQNGNYSEAAGFFEITARSPYASGWTSSAGSYWAARSHMRSGNVKDVNIWLKRGTYHPRTFYGLLSTRSLGYDFSFDWNIPNFTKEHQQLLEGTSVGRRAMDLVKVGQMHLAEVEFLHMDTGKNEAMRDALLYYAAHAKLAALGLRLGNLVLSSKGTYYDTAIYPTGAWSLKDGYKIDPALIHGIIRQESRFDAMAKSSSGAMGLMQLMPSTASYVDGNNKAHDLTDPETNINIGQKYIENLLTGRFVKGDLAALLVAYNAGPGNLARWKKTWGKKTWGKKNRVVEDPLLFIELLPSRETRVYVERVLANYWIYRIRDGLPTPTMDSIAAGKVARYADAGYVAPYKVAVK
ncbi:MAG: lytic transglycosylase domain-containing protein [Alphaproteobacteria bacterium]|nr:lytic transglycosylase domain-containing protein [Alphaproteobacteria bacterium]